MTTSNIFINKESLAYIPKLVGAPQVTSPAELTHGDLVSVYIPKQSVDTSIYITKAGSLDIYKTHHTDSTVSALPFSADTEYLGAPLTERVEALKLTFQTDQPISFHAKLPVPVQVIPPEFLTDQEYENQVRDFLVLVQDELHLVQGDIQGTVIGVSDLENSPKLLDIEEINDLSKYFYKSPVDKFFSYVHKYIADLMLEDLLDEFIKSTNTELPPSTQLAWADCWKFTELGATKTSRFVQLLVFGLILQDKIQNTVGGAYETKIQFMIVFRHTDQGYEAKPLLVIQLHDECLVFRLHKTKTEALSFISKEALTDYLREFGYESVFVSDLTPDVQTRVLTYVLKQGLSACKMDQVLDALAEKSNLLNPLLAEDVAVSEAVSAKDKGKRKEIEQLMKSVFNSLDKTGLNTKHYQDELFSLNDEAFFRFIKLLISNPRNNLELQVLPGKNEPRLEDIKEALDILKVPEMEYVYMRHEGNKNNPLRSRYKQTVGYIHIRRLQQLLSKKNTYSLSIKQRNLKNNQVTGHDAVARISDLEVSALKAINADATLRELMGPRADSSDMKAQLYNQISTYGYAELNAMDSRLENKRTLNTVAQYLIGAGLDNDLRTDYKMLINQLED